jgi:hypothetical protein
VRTERRAPRPGRTATAALSLAAAIAVAVAGCGDDGDASADRQAEVARRGAEVMPFDLDATTHRFTPVDDGLVQTVVADDPDDAEQVTLVRRHLDDEVARFRRGDYGDPAAIHGDDMPGLAELEAGATDIRVGYESTAAGGRITYTTSDAALVDALHRWGEAQTTDHGAHADHG